MRTLLSGCALLLATASAMAETVEVKYVGAVDLSTYQCVDTESSFVHRVCHDPERELMVILLRQTYYQYCRISAAVVSQLVGAPSVGKYYNANIKSSSNDGLYDCRR
jgi:hypothetical protein